MASPVPPGSASARVFLIPELVALILDYLESGVLPSIASTCTSIHRTAAARIWEEGGNDTLDHLSDILFGEGWYKHLHYDGSVAARWTRFSFYSALVKDMTIFFPLDDDTRQNLHSISAMLPSGAWLLPNLLSLDLEEMITVDDADSAALLLCPNLLKISVDAPDYEQARPMQEELHIASFLHKLASTANNLVVFKNHGTNKVVPPFTPSYQKIFALPLQHVAVGPVEPEVFAELARSDTLSNLVLCWTEGIPLFATAILSQVRSPFSRLSSVFLAMPIPTGTTLLRILSNAPLERLNFRVTPDPKPSASSMKQLFINAVGLAETLRHVSVYLEVTENDHVPWTTFEPLFACRLMKIFELSVDSSVPLDLCDEHVKIMAMAWPLLEQLKIRWDQSYTAHPAAGGLFGPARLTLNGLVHLSLHCPELANLSLTYFDAAVQLPRPAQNLQRRNLRAIYVGYAKIRSVTAVVLFISLIWPSASISPSLFGDHNGLALQRKKWERVSQILRIIELHCVFLAGGPDDGTSLLISESLSCLDN